MNWIFISSKGDLLEKTIVQLDKNLIEKALTDMLISSPVQYDKETDTLTITNDKETLATWIINARNTRRWTQNDLSIHAGISKSYVSQLERGFVHPAFKTYCSILLALLKSTSSISTNIVSTAKESLHIDNSDLELLLYKEDITHLLDILFFSSNKQNIKAVRDTLSDIADFSKMLNLTENNAFFDEQLKDVISKYTSDYSNRLLALKNQK